MASGQEAASSCLPRNFAAARPPLLFFAPGLSSCVGRVKLVLGGLDKERFLMSFASKKSISRNF